IGPTGEIKHATMSENVYNNQAQTFAKILRIPRNHIVNDDLGILTEATQKLGRGQALKLNQIFWTTWLANNATFFTTARGNYTSGSTTNLSLASLGVAVTAFYRQTDPDGDPLGVMPRYLVVPPEEATHADEIYQSTNVNTGGSSTTDRVPQANTL